MRSPALRLCRHNTAPASRLRLAHLDAPLRLPPAHQQYALSWTYVGGGSTFRTWTFTQTVRLTEVPQIVDLDGRIGFELAFMQEPTTGPLALANS